MLFSRHVRKMAVLTRCWCAVVTAAAAAMLLMSTPAVSVSPVSPGDMSPRSFSSLGDDLIFGDPSVESFFDLLPPSRNMDFYDMVTEMADGGVRSFLDALKSDQPPPRDFYSFLENNYALENGYYFEVTPNYQRALEFLEERGRLTLPAYVVPRGTQGYRYFYELDTTPLETFIQHNTELSHSTVAILNDFRSFLRDLSTVSTLYNVQPISLLQCTHVEFPEISYVAVEDIPEAFTKLKVTILPHCLGFDRVIDDSSSDFLEGLIHLTSPNNDGDLFVTDTAHRVSKSLQQDMKSFLHLFFTSLQREIEAGSISTDDNDFVILLQHTRNNMDNMENQLNTEQELKVVSSTVELNKMGIYYYGHTVMYYSDLKPIQVRIVKCGNGEEEKFANLANVESTQLARVVAILKIEDNCSVIYDLNVRPLQSRFGRAVNARNDNLRDPNFILERTRKNLDAYMELLRKGTYISLFSKSVVNTALNGVIFIPEADDIQEFNAENEALAVREMALFYTLGRIFQNNFFDGISEKPCRQFWFDEFFVKKRDPATSQLLAPFLKLIGNVEKDFVLTFLTGKHTLDDMEDHGLLAMESVDPIDRFAYHTGFQEHNSRCYLDFDSDNAEPNVRNEITIPIYDYEYFLRILKWVHETQEKYAITRVELQRLKDSDETMYVVLTRASNRYLPYDVTEDFFARRVLFFPYSWKGMDGTFVTTKFTATHPNPEFDKAISVGICRSAHMYEALKVDKTCVDIMKDFCVDDNPPSLYYPTTSPLLVKLENCAARLRLSAVLGEYNADYSGAHMHRQSYLRTFKLDERKSKGESATIRSIFSKMRYGTSRRRSSQPFVPRPSLLRNEESSVPDESDSDA